MNAHTPPLIDDCGACDRCTLNVASTSSASTTPTRTTRRRISDCTGCCCPIACPPLRKRLRRTGPTTDLTEQGDALVTTVPTYYPPLVVPPSPQDPSTMTSRPRKGHDATTNDHYHRVSPPTTPTSTSSPRTVEMTTSLRSPPPPAWQRNAVRASCPRIHKHVQHVIKQTPFLSTEPFKSATTLEGPVAKFSRHEIITGSVVGKGGFSQVSDVLQIQLDPNISATLTIAENVARQRVATQCWCGIPSSRPRYVLKHLQEKLLSLPSRQQQQHATTSSSPPVGADSSSSSAAHPNSSANEFAAAAVDLILEGEYVRRLNHPNIVSLVGMPHLSGARAYNDEGRYDGFFLLLEKVDTTLEDAMQLEVDEIEAATASFASYSSLPFVVQDDHSGARMRIPRSLDDKLSVSIQLAQALSYLHSLDIVFRDLKPQNVGLVAEPQGSCRVVLLDFGLCRQLPVDYGRQDQEARQEEEEQVSSSSRRRRHHRSIRGVYHMSAVGTRRYLAVEVVNSSRYNELADVFSWSLVLWEYLTLTRPFPNYDIAQHALHVCQQGERPDTNMLPREVQRLLQQCWTEDVSTRLAMDEVVTLLSAIVQSHYYNNVIMCDNAMDVEQNDATRDVAAAGLPQVDPSVERALDNSDMAVSIPSLHSAHARSFDATLELRGAAHPVSPVSWHLADFDPKVGILGGRKLNGSSATTRTLSSDGDNESHLLKDAMGGVLVTAALRHCSASDSCGSSSHLSALSVSSHLLDDDDDGNEHWAGSFDDDECHELSMSLVADPRAVATSRFDNESFW